MAYILLKGTNIMLNISSPPIVQIPLVVVVNKDDELLLNSPFTPWYPLLKNMPWQDYLAIGVMYYNALYHFNTCANKTANNTNTEILDESKEEAALRILSNRPTVDKNSPVIYEPEFKTVPYSTVSPSSIAPGIVPFRKDGKKPKCFFAMFNSFIGTTLMGFPAEPENVHMHLTSNPSFARVCGFIPKEPGDEYSFKHVPSLRKIEQFDQIMKDYGLWNLAKINEVRKNLEENIFEKENVVVGDTTHYHAYSGFETINYTGEDGKEKKKSQSKITKNCRCEDQDNCFHPWELADYGAGTIVKAYNKFIWGHKASILGLPLQGIPLDARCVADAATHDGQTFFPHMELLFLDFPELKLWFDFALYDSACDDKGLKDQFANEFGIELKASLNPRSRKTVTENLPKGMDRLTPSGNLICNGGFKMDYQGLRLDTEKFIYHAPVNDDNISVCSECDNKQSCSPASDKGRYVTIPFDMLPHIDTDDPPMSKRFKALMTRRPSVERMIKQLKCDLSDDRLTKRGNDSFQAHLDKTMIAFHILLRNQR